MDELFGEVISRYSRKQALEDGVLVDVSAMAREAGIKFPVAVTCAVFEILNDTSYPGQDVKGRAWDMLFVLRLAAKSSKGSQVHFAPLFVREGSAKPRPVPMRALCGPGDDLKPVITVMLEGED